MASNDGAAGRPSPRKLWLDADGDHARYIELMIEHGWIERITTLNGSAASERIDSWEQVALLAEKATAEANAPICSKCRRIVSLTDKGIVKVHFANNADTRPCVGSYKAWVG